MKKNILKGTIFIVILFFLVELCGYFLLPGENAKKYGIYKVSSYEILGEREDSIDVIMLGDSLVYTSVSPMEIWGKYGYTSYDCATPAQLIPEAYEYLNVAVESEHPKIVMMEAALLFRDPSKKAYYHKVLKKLENYVPLRKYHNNWKKGIKTKDNDSWIDVNKGYVYITKVEASTRKYHMSYKDGFADFPKGNLEIFNNIVKLCEENNIKLVLMGIPSQTSWNYKKYATIKNLAEEYHLDFIDYNLDNPLNIDWKTETKDGGLHLNYYGAKKVSEDLGKYLYNLGMLKDHRNESEFASWSIAYEKYQKNMSNES